MYATYHTQLPQENQLYMHLKQDYACLQYLLSVLKSNPEALGN